MFEAALIALDAITDPTRLAWMMAGVALGVTIGFLPGLGGSTGLAILLPFIFGMDVYNGVALLLGLASVSNTADTFPSVLIGVPGSSSSQATILDGYPMAQRGEGTTALAAAFIASAIGGIIGAIALFGALFVARPLVLALASPELLMLVILGLSLVGILSSGAPLAGLAAAIFGLLLGTIGAAPRVVLLRFDYDTFYLSRGIPLAVLAMGLFALPEVIDLLASRKPISNAPEQLGSRMDGLKAVIEHRWLVVRSSLLGVILGIIPGVGGSVIDWITYGVARQTCKDSESFGTGDIRGVIAPESANNAKEGGVLLPTLIFGIPGSGSMALLLGGFVLLGVEVGPAALTTNLNVTLAIVWTVAIANIAATSVSLAMSRPIGRLTLIPAQKLMPFLIVILTLAAFQSRKSWGDIIALFVFGALGWIMKQTGMPRAPLLIGFVLSTPAERYLGISMGRYGTEWMTRPGVLIIGTLTLMLLISGARSGRKPILPTSSADLAPIEGPVKDEGSR